MPDHDVPIFQTPADRLNTAIQTFGQESRMLPPGMQPQQLNLQQIEQVGGFDALVRMLIAAGVIDEQAFVEAKVTRMAEVVEQVVANLRQQKRDALGLVIAGSMPAGNAG